MKIAIIAALGRDRGIGHQGKLLWQIPEDLARFKHLTRRHPIIMGRKTFESILAIRGAPLPDRDTVVISGKDAYHPELEILRARDLGDALRIGLTLPRGEHGVFICGGARVYQDALAQGIVTKMYLTLVDAEKPADTFFPSFESRFTKVVFDVGRFWQGIPYRFAELEK